jgi:riboflavin kinase/FMN adenylyltransferase
MIRLFATFDPDPSRNRFEGAEWPATGQPPSVVAIGKFFALHRGHQMLIGEAVARARERGARSVVFTFDRHPVEVLRPGVAVPLLTTLPERLALMERQEVDAAVVARVTPEFLSLTPEQFVRDVLRGALHTVEVVASGSFRFGRGASGTLETLARLGETEGIAVRTLPEVLEGGERISSSRVAAELAAGRVAEAARLMGRPYSVCGEVVHGDGRGRELGFPTANLAVPPRRALPADGIYTVAAAWEGEIRGGVAHLGPRPAIGDATRMLEVHLFDFDADLYGKRLRVSFLHHLREVRAFASLAELTEQIGRDAAQGRALIPPDPRSLGDLAWFDKEVRLC